MTTTEPETVMWGLSVSIPYIQMQGILNRGGDLVVKGCDIAERRVIEAGATRDSLRWRADWDDIAMYLTVEGTSE